LIGAYGWRETMDAVETREAALERARRIVVADDATAALLQLDNGERHRVELVFSSLRQGGAPLRDLVVQRLRGKEPLFLLRVPGADAVRLIVRVDPDAIVVEDVVRPAMLARVFQATRL